MATAYEDEYICKVVSAGPDGRFTLNESGLRNVLCDPAICDKPVIVVSVAGAFRKGKSFLLNFLLRYLKAQGSREWLGDKNCQLEEGFHWRGGAEADTNGILLFKKPFFVRLPGSGETAVVLLMDTQGAFDSASSTEDIVGIFGLSTMISSIQIYNISGQLQKDNFDHLQFVVGYCRLAMDAGHDSVSKPLQRLVFLIRDWQNPDDYEYGLNGGNKLLKKKWLSSKTSEIADATAYLDSCFDKMECFLMPHPGKVVATRKEFKGQLRDIDDEFLECLNQFAPYVFANPEASCKRCNGEKVTCGNLLAYVRAYFKATQDGKMPRPESLFLASAQASNENALREAERFYEISMSQLIDGQNQPLSAEAFRQKHDEMGRIALEKFKTAKKLGTPEYFNEYEKRLRSQMDTMYPILEARNNQNLKMQLVAKEITATKVELENVRRNDSENKAKISSLESRLSTKDGELWNINNQMRNLEYQHKTQLTQLECSMKCQQAGEIRQLKQQMETQKSEMQQREEQRDREHQRERDEQRERDQQREREQQRVREQQQRGQQTGAGRPQEQRQSSPPRSTVTRIIVLPFGFPFGFPS